TARAARSRSTRAEGMNRNHRASLSDIGPKRSRSRPALSLPPSGSSRVSRRQPGASRAQKHVVIEGFGLSDHAADLEHPLHAPAARVTEDRGTRGVAQKRKI